MADHLKRRIGLGLLTAYGVGVMVGAGIYVLVGAVADAAGLAAPLAFLAAGLIAAPTALSYAEFSTRLPEAAGEAAYVGRGLGSEALAVLVGLAIVAAGTISAGAVLRGGVGYLGALWPVPPAWAIVGLGFALVVVAVLGVAEAMWMAAVFTVIELCGLALVVWAGFTAEPAAELAAQPFALWPGFWPEGVSGADLRAGIAAGAVLAFFAFIGFEDIVNMAEEVRRPERNLPLAILLALAITTGLYALVSIAAVRAVPVEELAASERPLALVWQAGRGGEARFLAAIAVFAALNGVLAQIVMASRVLFGLGKRSRALGVFHRAHPRFGTPVLGTVLVGAAVIVGAVAAPVAVLAEATSSILLAVFVLVNLALILEQRRNPDAPFRVWRIVPVAGMIAAGGALAANLGGMQWF